MSVRVYVPLTSRGLAALVADGRLPGPLRAHAVTEAARQAWPEAEEEDREYAALMAAADASWSLRGEGDRPRRHVVAADVPAVAPLPGEAAGPDADPAAEDPTLVEVAADVPWKRVAAAHVDTEDQPVDGPPPEDDLAWFATQEIRDLVREPS